MSESQFSQGALEKLQYYVYCLVDPRDKTIFYIGKGKNNRVFDHAEDALEDEDCETDKLETIREIIEQGLQVEHYIIRHNLTSKEALMVESVLIDLLTYSAINTESILTNIAAGHHQWDEGIKTVDEIEQLYNCKPLELKPGHKLLMVNINQSYQTKTVDGMRVKPNLYDATRRYWRVSKKKADEVDYLLGVYKGIVRCVIKPTTKWMASNVNEHGAKLSQTRYYVEGIIDDDEGNELYMNRSTTEYPFPSRGVIRYVRE